MNPYLPHYQHIPRQNVLTNPLQALLTIKKEPSYYCYCYYYYHHYFPHSIIFLQYLEMGRIFNLRLSTQI